jgi:hypothetical protein
LNKAYLLKEMFSQLWDYSADFRGGRNLPN